MLEDHAPAKINVCLLLGPTRPRDGRHELVTVMQNLDLADTLTTEDADEDEVVCPGVAGPNLALTALEAFRDLTGWDGPGQRIRITKRIPVAGGMAGGSADAAAALRLAHRRSGLGSEAVLLTIAEQLGADVPAQVTPGRWLAQGAGERLTALDPVAPYGVLVVPVPEPLSTGKVFAEADRRELPRSAEELLEAFAERAERGFDLPAALCTNDLAAPARALCPAIDDALAAVAEAGAAHAMVSGSGPTVLGFFASKDEAAAAATRLGRPAVAAAPLR